jgi:hypothetical protein
LVGSFGWVGVFLYTLITHYCRPRQPYKIVGGATKSTDTAEPPHGLQESGLSLTALVAGR